jgi:hypothetical protein
MSRKRGNRLSEGIMLKQCAEAQWRFYLKETAL